MDSEQKFWLGIIAIIAFSIVTVILGWIWGDQATVRNLAESGYEQKPYEVKTLGGWVWTKSE